MSGNTSSCPLKQLVYNIGTPGVIAHLYTSLDHTSSLILHSSKPIMGIDKYYSTFCGSSGTSHPVPIWWLTVHIVAYHSTLIAVSIVYGRNNRISVWPAGPKQVRQDPTVTARLSQHLTTRAIISFENV
jgi:hypothetical protein